MSWNNSTRDTAKENEALILTTTSISTTLRKRRSCRYCNTLPVFGFNSAKYDINLMKSYLLPILVNDWQIEPTVVKKANRFVSFKCCDVQLPDIMNFLGGATSLDTFVKAYRTTKLSAFSPMSGSTTPKCRTTKNYLHTIPSLANCVILTLSRKITTTLKTYY